VTKKRGRGRQDGSRPPLLPLTRRETPPATERRRFRVAGLFAGIGGIELGLHRAGHETAFLCEIDQSARAVLDARFPDITKHDDICTLPSLPKDADLLAAGFPCQDLSQAGMTAGIEGKRSGLIGKVLELLRRARRAQRPVPWLLIENVPFMLQLGRGRALAVIVDALESLGYRWAYRVVDSLAFGVPQRRERVFLVASLDGDPRGVLFADEEESEEFVPTPDLAFGFYWTEGTRGLGAAVDAVPTLKGGSAIGIPSPPGVLLPAGGGVVTPSIRDAERLQGFAPGWTEAVESATRKSYRWKLVGNAVTVPVAEWLGERLAVPGKYDGSWDRPLANAARWPSAAWSLGRGRFETIISTWPVRRPRPHLHDFLSEPRPLSARGTAGFWSRLASSTLRRPPWFNVGVQRHLTRMEKLESRQRGRRDEIEECRRPTRDEEVREAVTRC
jgi:DNA (cytosine-5)-methyltransferase 1